VHGRRIGSAGAELFSQAEAAYRSALEVYTREQAPQAWALAENELGVALTEQASLTIGARATELLAQAAYEKGAPGWIEGKAPQLSASDAEGTVTAKFDGVDGNVMVDRKLSVMTYPKSLMQALRQSAVAAENGYAIRWEVPDLNQANRATNMFNQLGIKNIQVVIVPNN